MSKESVDYGSRINNLADNLSRQHVSVSRDEIDRRNFFLLQQGDARSDACRLRCGDAVSSESVG